MKKIFYIFTVLFALLASHLFADDKITLLNVSYDPTREFYDAYNQSFVKYWKNKTGQDIKIVQSHGGSAKQARSVIDGLKADIVTLAIASDIDAIAEKSKLLQADWQTKLPHNSSPYNSVIVFLVRKDNPKNIKDWDDLIKENVQILTPNPKTSGGARWNYLAAWGYAYKKNNDSEDAAKEFVKQLFQHSSVLDTGARAATTNFTKRGIGDVLITWENEALYISKEMAKGEFEVIYPSISILAEPPVAVIEQNAIKNGTEKLANEYLSNLYSKESQELIAKFYYRPVDSEIFAKNSSSFPAISTFTANDLGGLKALSDKHFAEGGVFDKIYAR